MSYLDQKFNEAQFLNAEGFDYAEGKRAHGEEMYADGDGIRKENSLPIIINAENTGSAVDYNVELFDAINKAYSATPEISGVNSGVLLTSGIQGIEYKEIIRSIASGTVFGFNRVRIQTISAYTDSDRNSASDASITYVARNDMGSSTTTPLTPQISTIQNVLHVRDVQWDMIVNQYTKFIVSSINPGVKNQYSFFADRLENSTTSLIRGNTSKKFEVKNINAEVWK